jgi:hypothetical protein
MTAGIHTVVVRLDAIATTCIAVVIMMAIMTVGLTVPKYSTSVMVLKLSTLASISKHWCLEYLVQETLSQSYVIASGGDCKI